MKPFLKWAGGKRQLINTLLDYLPRDVKNSKIIKSYIEPFVGGGALFFYLKNHYKIEKSYLFDINKDLVITYNIVKNNPLELLKILREIEREYLCKNDRERERYYYEIRSLFNTQADFDYLYRAAYLIFLNKTCYNGLFRQNKKGEFNTPHGGYKNPKICNEENIIRASKALEDTEIICADFTKSSDYIDSNSFVYLDPPYLPIGKTSSFTAYSKDGFTIEDQIRLAKFYEDMSKRRAYLLLSNSDNNFFYKLYEKFYIHRINAKRSINCIGHKRGYVEELVITNYLIR